MFEKQNYDFGSKDPQKLKIAYTVEEVIQLLSLSRTSLYGIIKSGDLRARKCGRKTLILAKDINVFLDSLEDLQPNLAGHYLELENLNNQKLEN